MKKMIQLIFAVIVLTGITSEAWSQKNGYVTDDSYKTGIGLRVGSENGVTFKHFFKPTWAFEGTVTTGYRALVATALVEKHIHLLPDDGLDMLFGGGVHAGQWGRVVYYVPQYYDGTAYYVKRYRNSPSVGLDGIVGVEYRIPDIPFTIGADIKPFLDVFHPNESWVEGAFSVRYVFR
jgi:hypothetical protein